MMDWLNKWADDARKSLLTQVSRYQNATFLEAVVAACAIVAYADGEVKPEEKQKMIGFMQMSDELKVFSLEEVIELFNKASAKFEFDTEIGRLDALKTVKKLASNPDACRVMIRVCCLIGASDGNFDADEKKAVAEICRTVAIDPKEFQL